MPGHMTRDEVVERFRSERALFDAKVAAVPAEKLAVVPPGQAHSVRDIVVHVSAYEALIVERLRAARRGEVTEFDRDRDSWEAFNEHVWERTALVSQAEALAESAAVFEELLGELEKLTDDELNAAAGVATSLDPAWLGGRTLAELLAVDGFEHYPMHYPLLEVAAEV